MGGRNERIVDVYMDASSPTLERRCEVVDRLESLVRAGVLTRYTVRTWPKRVVLDGPNEDVTAVYHRFRQWAIGQGVSVERVFDRRAHDQQLIDEQGEQLSLPALMLAVYEDGELVMVAPHEDGGTRTTVDAVLQTLVERASEPTAVPH